MQKVQKKELVKLACAREALFRKSLFARKSELVILNRVIKTPCMHLNLERKLEYTTKRDIIPYCPGEINSPFL